MKKKKKEENKPLKVNTVFEELIKTSVKGNPKPKKKGKIKK